jgi:hypothetical protein
MRTSVLIALSLSVSCKATSRPVDGPAAPGITYDFNGSAYSGTSVGTATLMTNNAGGNDLGIQATDLGGHMLAIAVEPATPASMIAAGMFVTESAAPLSTFEFADGSDGTWAASGTVGGNGSITITSLTATEIQGTFQATLVGAGSAGPGAITNGAFDLPVN